MVRSARFALLLFVYAVALVSVSGCQSPTDDAEDPLEVDDFIDSTVAPSPTNAESAIGSGRTYRVVRGNNQPDEILEYDWHTSFSLSVRANNNATNDNVDLNFPVQLKSVTVKVEQASGGIVSPPTGGNVEHYDNDTTGVSSNAFGAVNQDISMNLDVYYDLPNLKKEALITVTLAFVDDDNTSFSKVVLVRVNP